MLVKDVAGWAGVCMCLGRPWHSHSPLLSPTPMRQRAARHQQLLDSKHKPVYPSPSPFPSGSQKTALAASCPLPAQPGALRLLVWMERSSPSHGESLGVPARHIHLCRPGPALSPSVCARHACLPLPLGTGQPTGAQSAWHMKELTTFPSYPVPFFVLKTLGRAPCLPLPER